MRLAGLVMLLAGCQYVFGVEPSAQPDAPGDAAAVRVEGTLTRVQIHNAKDGTPVTSVGAVDLARDCPTAFVGDSMLDRTCDAPGTFSFELPEQTLYRLRVETEEASPGLVIPTERLSTGLAPGITLVDWRRPDEIAAASGTQLQVSITDANGVPLVGAFNFGSNGVWTRSTHTANAGVATISWTAGLLDGAQGDRVFAFREYQPDAAGRPYLGQVYDRGEASVTMAQSTVTQTSIQLQPLMRSRCVHVAIDVPRLFARLGNLFPSIPPWRRGYAIYAAPSPEHGVVHIAPLSYDLVDVTSVPAQQTATFDQIELYPPALPGHTAVLLDLVDRLDRSTLAYTGIQVFHRLASEMCTSAPCCEEPPPPADPAMASELRLAGVNLDTPYKTVGVPLGEPAMLTWTITGGIAPDRISVALVERTMPLDPPAVVVRHRWFLPPDHTSLAFDPKLLEPGKIYFLQVATETGFPQASEGRFGPPFEFPVGSAIARSQPFYVDN